jgi:hypothetical protein
MIFSHTLDDAAAEADIAQLAATSPARPGKQSVPAGRSKGSTLRRRLRKRDSIVSKEVLHASLSLSLSLSHVL